MSNQQIAINSQSRLALNPNFVLRIEDDDCGLLFDPDNGQVQILNETAIHILQQLDGQRTLQEILDQLPEIFTGMPPDSDQQVLKLLDHLARLKAVGTWETA